MGRVYHVSSDSYNHIFQILMTSYKQTSQYPVLFWFQGSKKAEWELLKWRKKMIKSGNFIKKACCPEAVLNDST